MPLKKATYYGSQSVDIIYNGRIAIIYSSTYATSAYLAFLTSNYNTVGGKSELIKTGNVYISSLVHKSDGVDTIKVVAPSGYTWNVMYI